MARKKPEGNIIVYDIETTTYHADQAELKFFGYYSYLTKKAEVLEINNPEQIDKMRAIMEEHNVFVGFNNRKFDNVVLEKYGIDFKYRVIIDLWQILAPKSQGGKGRYMIMKGFKPKNFKLGTIVNHLGIGTKKDKGFDYKIFQKKESYTPQELVIINEYTHEDVSITRNLFEYLYNYFYSFSEYLSEKDNRRLVWLTSSVGGYAYKVICKLANIREDYADVHGAQKAYAGGYVALPTKEKATGKIFCFDLNSAYPHAFMMANLYSHNCTCCTDEEKYRGKGIFKLKGAYCSKQMGKIETVIRTLYNKRLEYKKTKDAREYTIKIVINCFSPDTEVLTRTGIKLMSDVKIGEELYSINPKTGKTQFKKVTDTITQQYTGPMYHFKDKNKDLLVTPNHKMIYQTKNGLQFEEAQYIHSRHDFPKSYPMNIIQKTTHKNNNPLTWTIDLSTFAYNCNRIIKFKNNHKWKNVMKKLEAKYDGNRRAYVLPAKPSLYDQYLMKLDEGNEDKLVTDVIYNHIQEKVKCSTIPSVVKYKDFLYLLGIYISEGSARIIPKKQYTTTLRGTCKCIQISQHMINKPIRDKIEQTLINMGIKYYKNSTEFVISNGILYDILTNYGGIGSENKGIYGPVLHLPPELLQYLHDGLYDGDGTKKQYRYTTKSKKLRDDMIRLNLQLGYRSFYKWEDNIWRIYRTPHGSYRHCIKKIEKNPFDTVVCVTVEDNHTVYAGRNGKFHWTGQTLYGISGSPIFKSIYNLNTAGDCTYIVRETIKYCRQQFIDNGYDVLYSDTDSVYLVDVYQDEQRILKLRDKMMTYLEACFPFPQTTFGMGIDDRMKAMFFFKTGNDFVKKNYMYVTDKDKIKIKGLPIIKSNATALGLHIYNMYLKQHIIDNLDCKFNIGFLKQLIYEELNKNINLAGQTYKVKDKESYKIKTSLNWRLANYIQKQFENGKINEKPDTVLLIPNTKIDLGEKMTHEAIKNRRKGYCTVEDFKNFKLHVSDIRFDKTLSELGPFTSNPQTTLNTF